MLPQRQNIANAVSADEIAENAMAVQVANAQPGENANNVELPPAIAVEIRDAIIALTQLFTRERGEAQAVGSDHLLRVGNGGASSSHYRTTTAAGN
ncbi:hypothetical protein CDL15_Pgr010445 [Punica granatum]|uniref:Uncharacterized protein n=1 Tax=Punica granatum TaxID=22663 RepID=A0A218VVV3_PUNGR|nr:hypothetical protein CDL15_Pgr010445 [Punica granatum]PKI36961.1 hypothetical protein CRG98_042662 [Punica granatum]